MGALSLWDTDFVSFRYIPRSEIAGSYGISIFNLLRKLHTVFHNGYTNLLSTNMYNGFLFSTSSQTLVISCLFDKSHPNRYEVISHYGFDLHLHDDYWCWASFHVPGYLYAFFEKILFRTFTHFLKSVYLFFWYWVVWVLYIFWILTLYQICDLQIFSLIL